MKKGTKKAAMMVLVICMLIQFKIPVEAAKIKTITANNWEWAEEAGLGKTKVRWIKDNEDSMNCYVKFKASKAGSYTFKLSNAKTLEKTGSKQILVAGLFAEENMYTTEEPEFLEEIGKYTGLIINGEEYLKEMQQENTDSEYNYKDTITIENVEKGKVIYIMFLGMNEDYQEENYIVTLNISYSKWNKKNKQSVEINEWETKQREICAYIEDRSPKRICTGTVTAYSNIVLPAYMQFKAPEDGSYKFTFSDVDTEVNKGALCNMEIKLKKANKKGGEIKYVKGKQVAMKGKTNKKKLGFGTQSDKTSGSFTVKNMKKGEIVYLEFTAKAVESDYVGCKMSIKKVK